MHPPLNLHIHITTPGGLCLKIVVLHHTLGEVDEFEAHVLASSHWSVQMKYFTSVVMNLALSVKTIQLRIIFTVVKSTVGVLKSLG